MKNKSNRVQNGVKLSEEDLGKMGGGYTMVKLNVEHVDGKPKFRETYEIINNRGLTVDKVDTLEEADKRNEELGLSKKIITREERDNLIFRTGK